jgi:hypothetical protein
MSVAPLTKWSDAGNPDPLLAAKAPQGFSGPNFHLLQVSSRAMYGTIVSDFGS